MFGLTALCLLLLQCGVQGFNIIHGKPQTHQHITERAIFNVTLQVCRSLAQAEGRHFTLPSLPWTAQSVVTACEAPQSSKSFQSSVNQIKKSNWLTDIWKVFRPPFHFDDETFKEGRQLITDGLSTVKAANKKHNYVTAKKKLGEILHTLQDFYSHSNWVEIGNKFPNSNLIRGEFQTEKIADKSRPTCRSCDGNDCSNNILEDILQEKILTSGYFAMFSSSKPKGKCSHGDFPDRTRNTKPKGGINKDTFTSSHGHLHMKAAVLATEATSELLEDVRGAAGDREFLQMMGISRRSSKALSFVIDTTGSMNEEIAAVRMIASSIVNNKVGTIDEPLSYVLVPFNDPNFGPLMRTTDSKEFKTYINSLSGTGGGDFPENCLSGLQLALAGTPLNSEIFLFTDSSVKDTYLKNTVTALIEETKSVVNFVITNTLGFRHRRQADGTEQPNFQMTSSDTQLYRDLARASGGLVIEVTKDQLAKASSIITESTSSSLVVLLQVSRSPGKAEKFTFSVDESVSKLMIYITGTSADFTLIDPSGVLQNDMTTKSLIISSQSVGNFQTLCLQTQVGVWEIRVVSNDPYTVKVVGESRVDFLFDFVKQSQGPSEGFDVIDNRPTAGGNVSLMVTLTGSDSATVTEVSLVESLGSGQLHGSVAAQGKGEFIVQFDTVPLFEFVVLVKGQYINSTSRASSGTFQRQSTISLRASTLTVTASDTDFVLEPGISEIVQFSVKTFGKGGNFEIRATIDQAFALSFPSSLSLDAEGSANGTVTITAPPNTPSGTAVTLTIEATAPGGADANYDVLRFTVLQPVTDFTQPVCKLLSQQSNCSDDCSQQSNCSDDCSQSMWELSTQVTDVADGTGVDRISLRRGRGTLESKTVAGNENTAEVSYVASCCSPDVQLVVVDQVGNVEICSYSVGKNAGVTFFSTTASRSFLFCLFHTILGLSLVS